MSKGNKAKVGDKIIMNQNYVTDDWVASKGDSGKVLCIDDDNDTRSLYTLEITGKGSVCVLGERFDLIPDQPATTKPPEKKPVEKGIRITVKEVEPNVLEIVDFTALDYGDLPAEYLNGFPNVRCCDNGHRLLVDYDGCQRGYSRGDRITRGQLDYLVKTCKEAGKRLREINTYPKEEFEIVI